MPRPSVPPELCCPRGDTGAQGAGRLISAAPKRTVAKEEAGDVGWIGQNPIPLEAYREFMKQNSQLREDQMLAPELSEVHGPAGDTEPAGRETM